MTASVAIIGAGPSGLFTAQALLRAVPGVVIDVIDRMPVPYGLIRYGVAPDHQGTKAITRQFDRMFERDGVHFHGHVEIGRHLALAELSELYDAVVIATGLSADRNLSIAGEDLPGVFRAGALTRWINSHPAESAMPELGPHVIVIGNGNVALDVARLLAKTEAEFQETDFDPSRAAAIASCRIKTIDIVGRSGPERCKFDAALVKEMAHLSAARTEVMMADDISAPDAESAARLAVFRTIHAAGPEDAPCRVRFRFGHVPSAILGRGRVEGMRFATSAGETVDLPATSIVTAIGFTADAQAGIARDAFLNGGEELSHALGGNLFTAGWFRRGAAGAIPDARRDARETADVIATSLPTGAQRPGRRGFASLMASRNIRTVSYADWQRIKAAEEAAAPAGRARLKFTSIADMIHQSTLAA